MGLRGDGAGGGPSVRGSRPARTGRAPRRARGEGARRGGQGARWLDAEAAPRDPSSAARDPSAVTWSHRRYLNGPGRPPISGFGFAPSSGPNSQGAQFSGGPILRGEGALRSGARVPTYVHCACGAPSPEARGRRPPCTPSSVLDFVHLGSMGAPLRCSRKPRRWLSRERPSLTGGACASGVGDGRGALRTERSDIFSTRDVDVRAGPFHGCSRCIADLRRAEFLIQNRSLSSVCTFCAGVCIPAR